MACDDLGITQRYVVYPGSERLGTRQGATAVGLEDLVAQLQTTI